MLPTWKKAVLGSVVLLVAGAAGCASTPQPFEYHDDRDEKPGAGIFSGEDGGFIIYGEPPAAPTDPPENTPDPDS